MAGIHYTKGTVTDLDTGKEYKLGDVLVIQACITDFSGNNRDHCKTEIVGGEGLVAIEDENGVLRIEEVESHAEGHMFTVTLVAKGIRNYTITGE